MAKYKITHHVDDCIGCGSCSAICPDFWELVEGNEYKAHLKGSKKVNNTEELEIEEKDFKCNKEAIDICPVECIKIEKI